MYCWYNTIQIIVCLFYEHENGVHKEWNLPLAGSITTTMHRYIFTLSEMNFLCAMLWNELEKKRKDVIVISVARI